MATKTMVVLANSIKKKQRCVAGREIQQADAELQVGSWLRPVSDEGEGELIVRKHCTLRQGGMPQVLDLVEVPLLENQNDPCQPENWQVETGAEWNKIGEVSAAEVEGWVEHPNDLWLEDPEHADRIAEQTQAGEAGSPSLVLIRPDQFRVRMWAEYNPFKGYNQHKTRGIFEYAGVEYSLSITDDSFTAKHCPKPDGDEHVFVPDIAENCALCVSLGAPFNGYHYKLIASVIPLTE